MSDFSRLLAYFADSKVDALILQSNRAIAVRINGEIAALSPTALADANLRQLLFTSPLAPHMDALGATPIKTLIQGPQGMELVATLSPHRDGLHCSIVRASARPQARRMSIPPNAPPLQAAPSKAQPAPATPSPTPQAKPSPAPASSPSSARQSPPTKPSGAAPTRPRPKPTRRRPGQIERTALEQHLATARELGASDIHIVSGSPILLRRMGSLERHGAEIEHRWVRTMVDQMLEPRDKAQLDERGYADFALESDELGRFRVNVCRHKKGLKACLRVLPEAPPSLEELGLPPELGEVLKHHQGLAVIAGPNGQGKSTTLAALVNKLNQERAIHIITVEDPIEVVHPISKAVISQRQVGRDTKSFQSALKASLREDPDVIVLGELRDRETVEMALSAAETGHLVIATMNTPSGAKTIGRLIDLFPPDDQSQVRATLAGTLMIVAAQRLVPRADQSGMVAAVEIITGGVPLWSLIRDNKLVQLPGLMQRGKRMGMIRLEDSLRQLLTQGIIDQSAFDQCLALESGPKAQAPAPEPPPQEGPSQDDPSSPALRNLFRKKSA